MIRSLMCLAILLLPAVLPAQVQDAPIDPAQLAAARELVAKLHLKDRFAARFSLSMNVGGLVDDCLRKNEHRANAEADRRDCEAKAQKVRAVYEPIRRKHLPGARARLLEAAAIAYARQLSPGDLSALNTFYGTPAGQRVAAAGPALDRAFAEAAADVDLKLMIDVLGDAEKELGK